MFDQYFAVVPGQRLLETGSTLLADAQFGTSANQGDLPGQRVWELVQADPDLHAAFGLHPVYLDDHRPEHLTELGDWLTRLAGHRQLCAVGEIGLDYFLEQLDRERQQSLFEAQLKLAVDFQLPALLHVLSLIHI